MSAPGSVTVWLRRLKTAEGEAVQKLWEGYFRRLVGLAHKKLHGRDRAAEGAEDVALSAFDSFCRGAEQGRFPCLSDRHDLWQILILITSRKAADLVKRESAQKRGGRRGFDASAAPADDA